MVLISQKWPRNTLMTLPLKTILLEEIEVLVKVMEETLPMVSPDESLDTVMQILARGEPAVLVMDRGKVVGIITKSDIIAHKVIHKKVKQ